MEPILAPVAAPPSALANPSRVRRFFRGAVYPLRGLRLLATHPRLWPWIAVPVALTLALLAGSGAAAMFVAPRALAMLWAQPATAGMLALWYVVATLVWLVVFGLAAVVLYAASGLLSTPFNDKLSQEVEILVRGPFDEPFSWPVFLADVRSSIAHSILGFGLWASVMAPLFLLELVPGVGSVLHFVLGGIATGLFLAREMMDGAMSRRRMRFVHKLRVVRAHLFVMQGFGTTTTAMLWIPLLNFLTLPVAVVGGTLLFCDLEAEGLVPADAGRPRTPSPSTD